MPTGVGYFISPTGEMIQVPEHFSYVQANPQVFGISPAQARRWDWTNDRDRILAQILSRGWIRIRAPQPGSFHIDTWVLDAATLQRIDTFLQEDEPWPNDRMWLSQISTGDRFQISVGEYESPGFRQHVAVRVELPCVVCRQARRSEMRILGSRMVETIQCGCGPRHINSLYRKRARALERVLNSFRSIHGIVGVSGSSESRLPPADNG